MALPDGAPGRSGLVGELVTLLGDARATAPDPTSAAAVDEIVGRLAEPLRVAIAGKVKAGKSTLLNALVGDRLAPTDSRECTRVVTWYRDAHTYRVEAFARDGSSRQCPFRRRDGELEIDLGTTSVDEVDRLVVWWPSSRLSEVTLIDTPGIGSITTDMSARTYSFLTADDDEPAAADAVLYLVRHLHNTDVRFLEAFHDDEMVRSTPVNAIGVLSRADEIGSCRLNAMETAARVADRYGDDARIRQLCRSVIPVAGLLAEAGATLREQDFRAVATLAADRDHDPVELALTTDRFVSPDVRTSVPAEHRRLLLGRLGLYGVRAGGRPDRRQRHRRPEGRAAVPAHGSEPAAQGPVGAGRVHLALARPPVAERRTVGRARRDDRRQRARDRGGAAAHRPVAGRARAAQRSPGRRPRAPARRARSLGRRAARARLRSHHGRPGPGRGRGPASLVAGGRAPDVVDAGQGRGPGRGAHQRGHPRGARPATADRRGRGSGWARRRTRAAEAASVRPCRRGASR
jgi:hypothetical protein